MVIGSKHSLIYKDIFFVLLFLKAILVTKNNEHNISIDKEYWDR